MINKSSVKNAIRVLRELTQSLTILKKIFREMSLRVEINDQRNSR